MYTVGNFPTAKSTIGQILARALFKILFRILDLEVEKKIGTPGSSSSWKIFWKKNFLEVASADF